MESRFLAPVHLGDELRDTADNGVTPNVTWKGRENWSIL